jgi:hypothetical protein
MIKLKDILNEFPVGTYTTLGGFEKGASYKDPRDRSALKHPVTIQKVKDMLKNTTVDFDFYFVNKPGLRKFSEKGKVSYEFLVNEYPNGLGLDPNQIKINTDNITIFFVSNTAADKIPMTAWTIIHRVGHVMNRTYTFQEYTKHIDKQFDELLDIYGLSSNKRDVYKNKRTYELAKGRLFNHIGTMRSARDSKLHRRPYEFYYELFVQYLKDGKITFNPLTKQILVGHGPYGSKTLATTQNLEDAQKLLDMIANTIPYLIEDVLSENVGGIFVM